MLRVWPPSWETGQIFPDERPLFDHHGQAFKGVVVVQVEIGVVGMTKRLAAGVVRIANHGYDASVGEFHNLSLLCIF